MENRKCNQSGRIDIGKQFEVAKEKRKKLDGESRKNKCDPDSWTTNILAAEKMKKRYDENIESFEGKGVVHENS